MVQMWQKTLTDRAAVQGGSVQCRHCLQWFLSHLASVWLERSYASETQFFVYRLLQPSLCQGTIQCSIQLEDGNFWSGPFNHTRELKTNRQTVLCLVWVYLGRSFLAWASDLHYRCRSAHRSYMSPVLPLALPDKTYWMDPGLDLTSHLEWWPLVHDKACCYCHRALLLTVPSLVTLALSSWCLEE